MAVPTDFAYLRRVIDAGEVLGPVLEVGGRDHQGGSGNARATCADAGLDWEGADIEPGPGVDFELDILDPDAVASVERRWRSVLVFNLLEHVYEPTLALRHALSLVAPGGVAVIVGPAVWQLHDYPRDYWRPMPDFYLEFARRQQVEVALEHFCWLLEQQERIIRVDELTTTDGRKQFPGRNTAAEVFGPFRAVASLYIQRALNLTGRVMHFPQVGLGVVLRKPV